jgi:hypothetical protein
MTDGGLFAQSTTDANRPMGGCEVASGGMTQAQIDIRAFAADDAAIWRTIRLEALANAPEAFGQALEHAERQRIDDYRQTVSGPFPPFAAFTGAYFGACTCHPHTVAAN